MQGLGQASALNNPLLNITIFAPVNSAFTAPLPPVCLLPYMPSLGMSCAHQQRTCDLHCIKARALYRVFEAMSLLLLFYSSSLPR